MGTRPEGGYGPIEQVVIGLKQNRRTKIVKIAIDI